MESKEDIKTIQAIAKLQTYVEVIGGDLKKQSVKIDTMDDKISDLRVTERGMIDSFSKVLAGFEDQRSDIKEIRKQTTETNGRVTKLEEYRKKHTKEFESLLESMNDKDERRTASIRWFMGIILTIILAAGPVMWFIFKLSVKDVVNTQIVSELDPCVFDLKDCVIEIIE